MSLLLHRAAERGDLQEVSRLANSDTVDETDKQGQTPLHYAARGGHPAVVQALLCSGAHLGVEDQGGRTPTMLAVLNQKEEAMGVLLGWPATASFEDIGGGNHSFSDVVKDNGPRVANRSRVAAGPPNQAEFQFHTNPTFADIKTTKNGWSELHHAAHAGLRSEVERLLSAGAEPDVCDENGRTPLHLASFAGHAAVVRRLLENGADPSAATADNSTANELAAAMGHNSIVSLLATSQQPHKRTQQADPPALRLRGGAVAQVQDRFQNAAADRVNRERAGNPRTRPAAGVPPTPRVGRHATTAFHEAAGATGRPNLVDLRSMLQNQYMPNEKDTYGVTALVYAAEAGFLEGVTLLLEKGADVHAVDKKLRTSLHLAARFGHLQVVKKLKGAHAGLDDKDSYGWTPLHYAVANDKIEVAEYLLKKGANAALPTQDGQTAADMAHASRNNAMLAALDNPKPGPGASGLSKKYHAKPHAKSPKAPAAADDIEEMMREISNLQYFNKRLEGERDHYKEAQNDLRWELDRSSPENVRSLSVENENLADQIKRMRVVVDDLEARNEQLIANQAPEAEAIAKANEMVQEMEQLSKKFNSERQDLKAEVKEGQDAMHNMELLMVEVARQMTMEKEKYRNDLELQKERLEYELEMDRQELQRQKAEYERRRQETEKKAKEYDDLLKELRKKIATDEKTAAAMANQDQEMAQLKKKLWEQNHDIEELESTVAGREQEVKAMQRRLRDQDAAIRDLKEQLGQEKANTEAYRLKFEEVEDQLRWLTEQRGGTEGELRKLRAVVQERDEAIQRLDDEVSRTNRELRRLSQDSTSLKEQLDHERNISQNHEDRARRAEAEVQRLMSLIDPSTNWQNEAQNLRSKLQEAEASLNKIRMEKDQLEHGIKPLEAALKQTQEALAHLQDEHNKAKTDLASAQADKIRMEEALRKAVESLRDERSKISLELDGLKWEKEDLQRQVQRLQAALLGAEAAGAHADAERMRIADELIKAQGVAHEASAKANSVASTANKQNRELQNLDEETRRLHTDRQQWQALAERLGAENDELVAEVQDLKDKVGRLQRENADLQNQVEKLSEENKLLEEQRRSGDFKAQKRVEAVEGAADRKCEKLHNALEDLQQRMRDKEAETNSLNGEVRRLKTKLEDYKTQRPGQPFRDWDRMEREISELEDQKQALGREVEMLEESKVELAKELQAMQRQMDDLSNAQEHLSKALIEKDQEAETAGRKEKELREQLKDTSRKQLAFTGSQLAEESLDISTKAVDGMLEAFLMPRKAIDRSVEVERKRTTARTGAQFPSRGFFSPRA